MENEKEVYENQKESIEEQQENIISMTEKEMEDFKTKIINETILQVEQKQKIQNEVNQAPEQNRAIINDLLSTGKDITEIKETYSHLFKEQDYTLDINKIINGESEPMLLTDDEKFIQEADKEGIAFKDTEKMKRYLDIKKRLRN